MHVLLCHICEPREPRESCGAVQSSKFVNRAWINFVLQDKLCTVCYVSRVDGINIFAISIKKSVFYSKYQLLSARFISRLSAIYWAALCENISSGHARKAKTQIRLRIRAVWSGSLLSAATFIGYYRMNKWRAKPRMILCACAGRSESSNFAHFSLDAALLISGRLRMADLSINEKIISPMINSEDGH